MAFTDKVKIIKTYIPEKVKIFIETNFLEELKYFQKKYQFKIELLPDDQLIIPEYKIELFNKSKKIINTIENIENIIKFKKPSKKEYKEKETKSSKVKQKKIKIKSFENSLGEKKKEKLNNTFCRGTWSK